jgi:hypothetical protein
MQIAATTRSGERIGRPPVGRFGRSEAVLI